MAFSVYGVTLLWVTQFPVTFPDLLAENGRLGNAQGVISAFSTIMSVHRGEVPCTVTTASVSRRLLLLYWGRSLSLRRPGVRPISD